MESFLLPRVNPEDVNAMGVRLRVYLWGGRMRRERLLGEARVSFDQINLQLETTLWLTLQPPPFSSVKHLYAIISVVVFFPILNVEENNGRMNVIFTGTRLGNN